MQTVNVYDDIIITKTEKNGEIKVTTDKEVLSNEKGNLAYMAARMLFDEFGINDGIEIRINKRIPIAGGMAGGSADCAATLKGINEMFKLNLDEKALMERGVKLGGRCPLLHNGWNGYCQRYWRNINTTAGTTEVSCYNSKTSGFRIYSICLWTHKAGFN